MTVSALPNTQDLGGDAVGAFVWRAGVDRSRATPVGVLIAHAGHACFVAWVEMSGCDRHEVESLAPLTVRGDVACPECGRTGELREGVWEPPSSG